MFEKGFSVLQDTHGKVGMNVKDCGDSWHVSGDGFSSLEEAKAWLDEKLYHGDRPWLRYFFNHAIVDHFGNIVHYDRNGGCWSQVDDTGKFGPKGRWVTLMKCKDGKERDMRNMKAIRYVNSQD